MASWLGKKGCKGDYSVIRRWYNSRGEDPKQARSWIKHVWQGTRCHMWCHGTSRMQLPNETHPKRGYIEYNIVYNEK